MLNLHRSETTRMLETIANERCPCGHLKQRHRKPSGDFRGEVMGACRDCPCRGLISMLDDDCEVCGQFGGDVDCPRCNP